METFADRLWWARHQKGIGANKLASLVGFSQSLLSSLERSNSTRSKYNDAFARVLEVDPNWLANGDADKAPAGFVSSEATRGREAAVSLQGGEARQGGSVIRLQSKLATRPRWTEGVATPAQNAEPALMKTLINTVMDLARLVGPERTKAMVEVAARAADLVSQSAQGEDEVSTGD